MNANPYNKEIYSKLLYDGIDEINTDYLPAGEYYIYFAGLNEDGPITIDISGDYIPTEGDVKENAIPVYVSSGSHFEDKKNTRSILEGGAGPYFLNDLGTKQNDVFYKLILEEVLDVSISHCSRGTTIEDTYMTLLNADGAVIYTNDDYTGKDRCGDRVKTSFLKKRLQPGVYYLVSEGYSSNGDIETLIDGYPPVDDMVQINTFDNYVKEIIPQKPVEEALALSTIGECNETIQYYDGLGRPSQYIRKNASPYNIADIITSTGYDEFGRQNKKWLPVVAIENNGNYISNLEEKANDTYGEESTYAFKETKYDRSPLNHIAAEVLPGGDWQSGGHMMSQNSRVNSDTETDLEVRLFEMEGDKLKKETASKVYSTGQLYVTQEIDEDDHVLYKFKDKDDKIILKRAKGESGNHDTQYVYDDLGRLRIVLSPMGVDELTLLSDTISLQKGNAIDRYAYLYNYDNQGRCIMKKFPGADSISMVYDRTDRLILFQDGNQRISNKWTFNKYDVLGRIIQSGEITLADKVAVLRNKFKDIAVIESFVSGYGYTNTLYNGLNTDFTIMTQNYYDNYDFLNLSGYSAYKANLTYTAQAEFDAKYMYTINDIDISAKGLLTGTTVSLLDNSGVLITANYYNDRGRVVQVLSNNHLGGYDKEYFAYNFTGQPLNKRHLHKAYSNPEITEDYTFTYDHTGRPLKTYHKVNTGPSILISSNIYDKLGRLDTIILHNGLQKIKYNYNIRGWLKSINSTEFKETLFYQDGASAGATPTYNGDISAQQWCTKQEGNALCQYRFTYDKLNRLKKATYSPDELYNEEIGLYDKNGNIQGLTRNGHIFDYWDTYDWIPGIADDLTLEYNGNQLKNVTNNVDTEFGSPIFVDKWDENNPVEYLYDNNGNQIADLNKSIAWMKYNSLDLPEKIQFSDGNKSQYLYDAAGVKRKAYYTYAAAPLQTPIELGDTRQEYNGALNGAWVIDYCGNYIYEQGVLKKILTPVGYFVPGFISNVYYPVISRYYYYLKDHLGNNRVCLQSDNLSKPTSKIYSIAQVNHYYPFGQETDSKNFLPNNGQTYLYNGKEMDRLNGLNMLDYGARWYDPTIGRWGGGDPLAEKHHNDSPYVFCANNPKNLIDPDGQNWYRSKDGSAMTWRKGDAATFTQTIEGSEGAITLDFQDVGSTFCQMLSDGTTVSWEQNQLSTVKEQPILSQRRNESHYDQLDGYMIYYSGGKGHGLDINSKYTSGSFDASWIGILKNYSATWKTLEDLIDGLKSRMEGYGPALKDMWNGINGGDKKVDSNPKEEQDEAIFESVGYDTHYQLDKNGVQRNRPDTDSIIIYRKYKSGKEEKNISPWRK